MRTEQAAGPRRVRTRYGAEDRQRLIREQAQSGLSKTAFCAQRGINLGTFHGWARRPQALARKPAFAEVEVTGYAQAAVEVLLPNGARVGIRHEGKRDELIALVRGVAGC
jgi:transposase-like protein